MVTFLTYQQRLSLFGKGGRAAPTYMLHQAMIATPVTFCKGWQSGSKLTHAPYEKAQTSEEFPYPNPNPNPNPIYMQAAERLQHTCYTREIHQIMVAFSTHQLSY